MFHAELRQFPYVARAFNLNAEEFEARILGPWVRGEAVLWDDRRWLPEKARLTIFEAPELSGEKMGLGRGWANVTRAGSDVTATLVGEARARLRADPALRSLKLELLELSREQRVELVTAVRLASNAAPQTTLSARLGLAERAVWELLHENELELLDEHGAPVEPDHWRPLLLRWESWSEGILRVRAREAR